MIILFIILYILIAAVCIFLLLVTADKYTDYNSNTDPSWPVICGIAWPIGAPIAAAYIGAEYYLKYKDNMGDE